MNEPCCQFHQRLTRAFFVRNFGAKPNVTREKLLKRRSYEKHTQKTLMKLTPKHTCWTCCKRNRGEHLCSFPGWRPTVGCTSRIDLCSQLHQHFTECITNLGWLGNYFRVTFESSVIFLRQLGKYRKMSLTLTQTKVNQSIYTF